MLQDKTGKSTLPLFIISIVLVKIDVPHMLNDACKLRLDLKEQRYRGNQVLWTVKEAKTYNGNISISTNSRHGLAFALISERKEKKKGPRKKR